MTGDECSNARARIRSLTFLVPLVLLAVAGSAALAADGAIDARPVDRWYDATQAERGRPIYATRCAICHGDRAAGQPDWEERDSSGYYPAPPLDGTGHSAMHPPAQMLRTLDTGGGPLGGTMRSFIDVLTDADQRAVLDED